MELGLNFAGIAEEIAQEMVLGVVFEGLKGEGESGVGVLSESFGGVVAFDFEVVDGLFQEEFLEADFDLLGAEDAPGVGGELGGEETLVGGLGGEVAFEAGLEGDEVVGVFEGENWKPGGEAVLEGIQAGVGLAGLGAGAGGLLRIPLTCGALCFGERTGHGSAWHGDFREGPAFGGIGGAKSFVWSGIFFDGVGNGASEGWGAGGEMDRKSPHLIDLMMLI